MPNYTYSRVSITLPPEVLAAADRLAQAHDRPRSWVFAEAIRRFGGPGMAPPAVAPAIAPAPEEGSAILEEDASHPDLNRLPSDLALSTEERVRAAEQAAMASQTEPGANRPGDQILFFNRFEEYLRWDQRSRSAS